MEKIFINWLTKIKKSGGLLFFFLIFNTEKLWDGLPVFKKMIETWYADALEMTFKT